MPDLRQDLESRMCPNQAQMTTAAKAFWYNTAAQNVLMPIIFLEKEYGIWTEDVQVVHVDIPYISHSDHDWREMRDKVAEHCEKLRQGLGRRCTYGFINFHTDMAWAVFEDIPPS